MKLLYGYLAGLVFGFVMGVLTGANAHAERGSHHENWGPAYAAVIRIEHQELKPIREG